MADKSITQTIKDAEVDARSLSEFIYSPADAMISRRLAPSIHSLQYYLDFLDTIPSIVQNAIDNTVIENGVVTDSLVVVDGSMTQAKVNKGLESIADLSTINNPKDGLRVYVKSYHAGLGRGGGYFTYDSSRASENDSGTVINGWVRDEVTDLDVLMFGARADGSSDDAPSFNTATDAAFAMGGGVVRVPSGSYLVKDTVWLKDNVHIKGDGSSSTVVDQKSLEFDLISTPKKTESSLTLSSNLNIGDAENALANSLSVGDCIIYSSDALITKRWTEKVLRSWYKECEMMVVEKATPESVTFVDPSSIYCRLADNPVVKYFKPTYNVSVSGLTVKKDYAAVNSSVGVNLTHTAHARVDDLITKNYNNTGLMISKSYNSYATKTKHYAGISDSGLCYGVAYMSGSRRCVHDGVYATGCRHGVTMGGEGGNPAYNTVLNAQIENTVIASLDFHGCAMHSKYINSVVDGGLQLSGVGNTVDSMVSVSSNKVLSDGSMEGYGLDIYEGGVDLTIKNVQAKDAIRLYARENVIGLTINGLSMRSSAFWRMEVPNTSRGIKIDSSEFVCYKSSKAKTLDEANKCFYGSSLENGLGQLLTEGACISNVSIEGFPRALTVSYKSINAVNIKLHNCGFKRVSGAGVTRAPVYITNATNAFIDNISISRDNPVLVGYDYDLLVNPSSNISKLTLSNITNNAVLASTLPNYGSRLSIDSISKSTIINVNLDGSLAGGWTDEPVEPDTSGNNIIASDIYKALP